MPKIIKIFISIFLLLIISLEANQSKRCDPLKKISLQLQWKYQFQFAGFIVAKEKGYYKEVGLDVELLEYNNTNSMQDLIDKKIDFAINNSIVVYKDKKLQAVTLLATYFQRSPLIIITQPEIKSVIGLHGSTIAMSDNYIYNSSLSMLLEHFSINKKNTNFVNPTFLLDNFILKKVDAITAFKSNEVFELDKQGIKYNIIDPVEYGFSTNAINLFTSYSMVKNRPKLINNFLKANKKGWEYALEHIDEVAILIHNKYNKNKSIELLKYEGKITKELMLLNLYEIGSINKSFVHSTYKQLIKTNKISNKKNMDKLTYPPKSIGKNKIDLNWITINIEKKIDKRWIVFILVFSTFIIFAFILRHYLLKKSNKELQEMKNLFELSVDSGNIGIWDWNLITNDVYFSDSWLKMLGFKKNELPYTMKSWRKQIHPDDLKQTMQYFRKIIGDNEEYSQGSHRLRKKDGSYIWILYNTRMFFNNKNKAVRILGTHIDITKEKNMQEELTKQKDSLHYQAHHDSLTKLPNRTLFQDRLEQGLEYSKRNNKKLALFFIDLDHFKEINDSLGHEYGDKILIEVSSRLLEVLREEDTLARLGGDEFTVIVKDLNEAQNASLLAQKIIEVLKEPIIIDEHTLYVSCSVGISLYPNDGISAQNLLKYADAAMYKAKDSGRNDFQFYSSEMTELAFERVVMEASLREAIKNNEFIVYYQPQVDARENKIIGMEALVRWKHPTMGIVSPSKFIPLAELTGLIINIDRYVMQNAMKQIVKWYKMGLNPGKLSINLSIKQLEKEECIPVLKSMLKDFKCKSEWLELEVTEGQIMKNPEEAIITLTQISELGINLAIDDFGTGYSSLSYLKKFPISKLKIDQSFVRDLPYDEEDVAISKAVIALGKSLNLKLIAEGVETKEQKEFLLENGCDNIQGYFYAKPMPAYDMEKFLVNGL